MHVKNIDMRNFFCHRQSFLQLPSSGIVLVRGPNGSGKSAIVEAVSVACWGKTLRGSEPWAGNEESVAAVEACNRFGNPRTGLYAKRSRSGKRTDLTWHYEDREPERYESTTKAQMALGSVVGSWDVWRKCSVFSSQDASNFSRATDAERKRLLEGLLCLSCFDEASSQCRGWLRDCEAAMVPLRAAVGVLEHRLGWERERLESERQRLSLSVPEPDTERKPICEDTLESMQERLERLKHMRELAHEEMLLNERELRSARDAGVESSVLERQLRATIARLRNISECPTCGQKISESLRQDLQGKADEQAAKAKEAELEKAEELQTLEGLVDELRTELTHLDKSIVDLELARSAKEKDDRREKELRALRDNAEANVEKVAEAIAKTERSLAEAILGRDRAEKELRTAEVCDSVLGLKGVRAHILSEALEGIEAVANHWVGQLFCSDVRVKLSSYSEKKTGGVSDSISLHIDGLGLGGYAGCSGGERRRVDVALLLALAEIASASSGQEPGTLFLDEVFDTLDRDAVERVSSALQSIAKNRCVVVISHSNALEEALDADMVVSVENGELS